MLYRIRAHHGMCFSFYQGKGYSGEFTDHMWAMKRKLEQNPEVILLCGADDVCTHCPNDHGGLCVSADRTERYDRQTLAHCGLTEETRIRWQDYEELVREKILAKGLRAAICGDCQWNAVCSYTEPAG